MKKSSTSSSSGNIIKSSNENLNVSRRLPRPNGATALATEAIISKDANLKKAWVDFMVNQWLLSNGFICGIQYDVQTFAKGLNISVDEIRVRMRDTLIQSRIFDRDKQEKLLYGLMGELVSWTMEDRMKINAQINLLTKAQEGKYKPFISAELNKALKLGLESGTALQGVLARLVGGGTTNVFNLFQQNNDNSVTNNYVTTSEVLEIIADENKQLDKSEQAKLLETRYDLNSLPVVVATEQEGVDTSKEGLGGKINITELNSITDNMKDAMSSADEDHHSMRREIEMRIDPDEEDPELSQYDDYEEVQKEKPFSASDFLNS